MEQIATRTVAASDLVRQFGIWRDVAAREPVYVQHRGRPRLVLASVELMAALCMPHNEDRAHFEAREAALLDTIAQPALIVDESLTIVAVGRAARHYFGAQADRGAPLAAALSADVAPVLLAVAARVVAGGVEETIEVATAARRLEIRVAPHPAGALLVGRDRAVEDARDQAQELAAATLTVLAALPGHAIARIGLRGYLARADASLEQLTGFTAAALASTRFVTLFDVASRVVVGEAIERAFDTRQVGGCAATLLANHGAPAAARLAFAPERRGAAVVGVLALISTETSAKHG